MIRKDGVVTTPRAPSVSPNPTTPEPSSTIKGRGRPNVIYFVYYYVV